MADEEGAGKWLEGWHPGSVIKILDSGPPEHTLTDLNLGPSHPNFETDERMRPAPAGLFSEKIKEGSDSLLPGSVIKVFQDSKDVPSKNTYSTGEVRAAGSDLFAEQAKKDPSSLLPGSVIRIY